MPPQSVCNIALNLFNVNREFIPVSLFIVSVFWASLLLRCVTVVISRVKVTQTERGNACSGAKKKRGALHALPDSEIYTADYT